MKKLFLITVLISTACQQSSTTTEYNCDPNADVALCDLEHCQILSARNYQWMEENNYNLCEATSFEVCVPAFGRVSEDDPRACLGTANFCSTDSDGNKRVIENIQGNEWDPSSGNGGEYFKILQGWELCNCASNENDCKKMLKYTTNYNSEYNSICKHCGDGIGNGILSSSEYCDGDYYSNECRSYTYFPDGAPCDLQSGFTSGLMTCRADCTFDTSNCQ